MAIYRGAGGAGDATNDATSQAILAAQSAVEAAQSATSATASATSASGSATAAANSASAASTSASNAASSQSSAATSASNAATSATNAANSANDAAASASNAATSESNADASAITAINAASDASDSASNAATSATSSATSAANSATSETNAANSALDAADSATAAQTAETNAETAETNAASSASSAVTSASTATTQAANASNSALDAATSETNAANSETAAATSATNAASSATSAANSASAALTSANNAAASYDAFDDRYLGSKTSDPTVDNDGNPLLTGALYFDSVNNSMKVYDGSAWNPAYVSISGALLKANNLSDLNSVSTARTNLGLGTAATTNSTTYATAAQGTKADTAYGWGNHADAGYAADSSVVHKTGDETVAGTKTFSSTISGSVTGNAGTVTNGVYTTGSYSDPSWITSVAGSKVSGNIAGNAANVTGTVATSNGGTGLTSFINQGVLYASSTSALTTSNNLKFTGNHLGIGVGPRTTSGAHIASEIGQTGYLAGVGANQGVYLQSNAYFATGGINTYSTIAAATSYEQISGAHKWYTKASGSANTAVDFGDPKMTLDIAGNLYVGSNLALHAGNYNSYSPTLTGTGASGTWGISITGNSATVTNGVYTSGDQTVGGTKTFSSNPVLSSGTANGVAYLNGSKVLTTGSALTFDGTNLGIGVSAPTASLQITKSAGATTFSLNQSALPVVDNRIGLIGFGTDSDSFKARVSGFAAANWTAGSSTPTYLAFHTTPSGSATAQERMRLDSSGNLGLGVTPSAWGFGGNLQTAIGSYHAGGNYTYRTANVYYNGGEKYITSASACKYSQYDGVHAWYTAPSGTAGNAISFTQAMTLDASGNLGIGTTSPYVKLHSQTSIVSGASRGGVNTKALFETNGAQYVELQSSPTSQTNGLLFSQGSSGAYGLINYDNNNAVLQLYTNSTERMRIDSLGGLSVLKSSVNASYFGASPSASASANVTAFQAFFDYVTTNGVKGIIDTGVYNINAPIYINVKGVSFSIEGAGSTYTIFNESSFTGSAMVTVRASTGYNNTNWSIGGFKITGTGSGVAQGLYIGNATAGATQLAGTLCSTISDVYVADIQYGIFVQNSRLVRFNNCSYWCTSTTLQYRRGLTISQTGGFCGDLVFDNCQFYTESGSSTNMNVLIDSSATGTFNPTVSGNYSIAGLKFLNCTFYKSYLNVYAQSAFGSAIRDLWFTNCQVDAANTYGFYFTAYASSNIDNIHIDGCYVNGGISGQVIFTTDGTGKIYEATVSNCQLMQGSGNAILVNTTNCINFNIHNNMVVSNNHTGGAAIYAAGTRIAVNKNSLTVDPYYNQKPAYFIQFQSGATDITCIGNNARGNVTTAVILDSSGDVYKTIEKNLGYNPVYFRTVTPTGSPYAYKNTRGYTENVLISGGTVTALNVDSFAQTAATNTYVQVPHQSTLTVTYSSAPTLYPRQL